MDKPYIFNKTRCFVRVCYTFVQQYLANVAYYGPYEFNAGLSWADVLR